MAEPKPLVDILKDADYDTTLPCLEPDWNDLQLIEALVARLKETGSKEDTPLIERAEERLKN